MSTAKQTAALIAMTLPGSRPDIPDVDDGERGHDHREGHVDLLPRVEQELRLGAHHAAAVDAHRAGGAADQIAARGAGHPEAAELAAARPPAAGPAQVLAEDPAE